MYPNHFGNTRDGLYRRRVEYVYSTQSRVPGAGTSKGAGPLTVEESGTYFYVPPVTGMVFQLPKISSKWLGVEYTWFVSTQTAGTVKINCALDSSAGIHTNFSSEVSVHSTIVTDSSFPSAVTLTAVSSIAWMGQPIMCNSYMATTKKTDDSTTVKASLSGWTTG